MHLPKIALASLPWATLLVVGCGDDESPTTEPSPATTQIRYLLSASVPTPDGDPAFVVPLEELPTSGDLSLANGLEFTGGIDMHTFGENVYIMDFGDQGLTRYQIIDNELVAQNRLSFADRGGVNYFFFLDEKRAFTVNRPQLELVEFDPIAMTVTRTIDLSAIERADIDHEIRRGFLRAEDNTLFLYVAYTNMRQTFDNTLVLAVIDLDAGTTTIERQEDCPASAGFGGFFDDDGTLYVMGDSFGGFTLLLDPSQVKPNCVVRIQPGSRTFDPDYLFRPGASMEGAETWGLFEAGDGVALTNGINLPRIREFMGPIEFLGAPIHEGWSVDVRNQRVQRILSLPTGGIGLSSFTVGDRLLIPRASGEIMNGDTQTATTRVFSFDPGTNEATEMFGLPGFLNQVLEF